CFFLKSVIDLVILRENLPRTFGREHHDHRAQRCRQRHDLTMSSQPGVVAFWTIDEVPRMVDRESRSVGQPVLNHAQAVVWCASGAGRAVAPLTAANGTLSCRSASSAGTGMNPMPVRYRRYVSNNL